MKAKQRRRIHFWLMVGWAVQLVLVWFIPEDLRIPYLILCSVYVNFVGHWSAYSAETPVEREDDDDAA